MDSKLVDIIEKVRHELLINDDSILIGDLNDGMENGNDIPIKSYGSFLSICNGARCGAIDLWSYNTFLKSQYKVTDIQGGKDKWVCIGQIIYEPLVASIENEDIYLFYQGFEKEIPGKYLGYFDDFLSNYVFGKKYSELFPNAEKEEWYMMLKRLNLF